MGYALNNSTIRICPGRYLAETSLFVTIASILAAFNIEKDTDANGKLITPPLEYTSGAIRFVQFILHINMASFDRYSRSSHPVPFDCTITPRSKKAEAVVLQSSKQSPEFLKPILEDPVVYVHGDLAMQNVLVHNGRVSGIIDWEDSGWFPRHWMVHKLRTPRPGCEGFWLRYWIFHRFDPVMEDAYDTGLCEDMLLYRI